ncbi:hypothetical protein [Pseudomonas tolaasii]|uniref:hypothetical protein n=1 Tax=Pseudomonas tolaasii TaxID=29442 RepID=UPI00036AD18D|nr:hypothetical protein [Pseudomonas tolaasii]
MAITWIEIVDTAVKIGLGAGVTGFATLLVNRQNHAKNIERENHLRNIAVLESVTQHIEEMTHALLKHWSFVLEKARNKEKGVSTSDEKSEKLMS